jgi:hypothetical protein
MSARPKVNKGCFDLELERLEAWNPFKRTVWPGLEKPVTEAEVLKQIDLRSLYRFPIVQNWTMKPVLRVVHVARIAYFVVRGWRKPIDIDVGVPEMNCHVDWIIVDGNHRLAAAFFCRDESILACISGSLEYACSRLGVPSINQH